ncbi:MAG: hypothetical protein VBE63_14535 [Lamprobacter sp.]|uniref:hypothetical protein n=1 Tax=Lamprobacter sp. TaxID=3100796 RepID=UPI002B2579D8|nr:hypothetical protein [Lamprobacter sp.]MEA3641141.1 hypothetical protein [Lamprobacter sp.]
MKAKLLLSYRRKLSASLFKEIHVWRLPQPLAGSSHPYKYRLALVNGDHKHIDDQECALTFSSMPQLLIDFDRDIQYWRQYP